MNLLLSRKSWSVDDWVAWLHSADQSPEQQSQVLADLAQVREAGQRVLSALPPLPPKDTPGANVNMARSHGAGWQSLDARSPQPLRVRR